MRWVLRIFAGLLVLLTVAAVGLWIWKPWVPPVQMSDPGPTGKRIDGDGILANYYAGPDGARGPGVVVLGGSEGGLGLGMKRVGLALQEAGFSVLQVSYFRGPEQPEALEHIPLETIFKGLDWLMKQPTVDASRIGIVGASKGAEAALLVATHRPEIRAVVLGMPTSVVWMGVDWNRGGGGTRSSWTLGGEPLPALPYGEFNWEEGVVSIYRSGLEAVGEHPGVVIPVERTKAPMLLLCGEQDTLWPGCPMARQIEARAQAKGGPDVELRAFADAGHGVFGLPVAEGSPGYDRLSSLGGTTAGNAKARVEGWPAIVSFLEKHLAAKEADPPPASPPE